MNTNYTNVTSVTPKITFALAVVVCVAALGSPRVSFAAISTDSSALQLPSSLNEVISRLPAPLRDFARDIEQRFHAIQISISSPVASSTNIRIPQQFSVHEILQFVKESIIFVGGFAVVILRIVADFIESVVRWMQSFLLTP